MSHSGAGAVLEAILGMARAGALALGMGALALLPACAPLDGDDGGSLALASEGAAVTADNGLTTNGLTTNGLTTNGLTTNGLTTNGLTTNGLTTNGLSTVEFVRWYASNPPGYSDMVMHYVVACALPAGASLSFQAPDGTVHTWAGNLGVAPDWASGLPASEDEQQLMTACLAAHVNKFGIHVPVSVNGWNARGEPLRMDPDEQATFSEPEGCFFGNLFNGEGIYSGSDRQLSEEESTARACGLSTSGRAHEQCAPMENVGPCQSACLVDRESPFYSRCFFHGKWYRALTTRLRPREIFRCGDGVCQFTERPGPGHTVDSCRADCGELPREHVRPGKGLHADWTR